MDKTEQPRLSETTAILVSLLAFALLLPILWFALSIIFFTLVLAAGKPDTNDGLIAIVAAVALGIDCYLVRALYKHFRSPRSKDASHAAISISIGDWFSAIVSFGLVWLLLLVLSPFVLQLFGVNPLAPSAIACTTLFPPVVATGNVVVFLKGQKRKRERAERERLTAAGLFCACGYNLTGNVSGVCPECGETL